ncbi:SRPBCC domain-containing protein [Amycolatopsis sulphurea]|uniref:SRPBCC domain-containing protein n=1 Tax=Amycolatopsis sulphurea TaxID=76022 RepID=UPI003183112D
MFRAWTDPEQLANWLGPQKFRAPDVATDPRPGGCLAGPDHQHRIRRGPPDERGLPRGGPARVPAKSV